MEHPEIDEAVVRQFFPILQEFYTVTFEDIKWVYKMPDFQPGQKSALVDIELPTGAERIRMDIIPYGRWAFAYAPKMGRLILGWADDVYGNDESPLPA